MLRLTLLALFSLHAFAQSPSEDLQKGLAAYQNKQFAEAQTSFQKVLEQKKNNPAVLNDLALTALQLEQKPLALALWRKALVVAPNYTPAREGRDLLEKQMAMRSLERDAYALWEHRGLERFPLYVILLLNAVFLAAAGALWIRYLSLRARALDEERELPAFPTAATLASVALGLTIFLSAVKALDTFNERATVLGVKVSARSLPANESVALFDVSGGNEVLVKREQGDWTQIQNGEGNSGWIKNSDLLITSER